MLIVAHDDTHIWLARVCCYSLDIQMRLRRPILLNRYSFLTSLDFYDCRAISVEGRRPIWNHAESNHQVCSHHKAGARRSRARIRFPGIIVLLLLPYWILLLYARSVVQ